MRKVGYLFVIIVSMQLCNVCVAQHAKNITAKKILIPYFRTPLGVPTQIRGQFENTGTENLTSVNVAATVSNPQGVIVYRDTQTFSLWESGEVKDTTFRDFTPTQKGYYKFCLVCLLSGDEDVSDDKTCDSVKAVYERGLSAVAVVFPPPDTVMPAYQAFQPIGSVVERGGINDYFDIRARVQIKRCGDGKLMYQADTSIPEVYLDAPPINFVLPSSTPTFNTKDLPPGCYTIATIILLSDDVDRTDDTAYALFTLSELSVEPHDDDIFYFGSVYPNPAQSSVTLEYHLPDNGRVHIRLLDPIGKIAKELASGELQFEGDHSITVSTLDLSESIYLFEFTFIDSDGTNHQSSKKIIVVK